MSATRQREYRARQQAGRVCVQVEVSERHADMGGAVLSGPPTEFGKVLADETEKWGKVIKFAGIRAE